MAPKRPLENEETTSPPRKQRGGFKVGPDNLPDGTWRRKVIKIKKDLIHKAKVKKSYAKIKAQELSTITEAAVSSEVSAAAPAQELHPERQAMLDAPREDTPPPRTSQSFPSRQTTEKRRNKKPGYFEKEVAFAERKKQEQEERRKEFERREKEKKEKIEERERFRKAMAKARTGGRNGQRKMGRESKVLLERVQKLVGGS